MAESLSLEIYCYHFFRGRIHIIQAPFRFFNATFMEIYCRNLYVHIYNWTVKEVSLSNMNCGFPGFFFNLTSRPVLCRLISDLLLCFRTYHKVLKVTLQYMKFYFFRNCHHHIFLHDTEKRELNLPFSLWLEKLICGLFSLGSLMKKDRKINHILRQKLCVENR